MSDAEIAVELPHPTSLNMVNDHADEDSKKAAAVTANKLRVAERCIALVIDFGSGVFGLLGKRYLGGR